MVRTMTVAVLIAMLAAVPASAEPRRFGLQQIGYGAGGAVGHMADGLLVFGASQDIAVSPAAVACLEVGPEQWGFFLGLDSAPLATMWTFAPGDEAHAPPRPSPFRWAIERFFLGHEVSQTRCVHVGGSAGGWRWIAGLRIPLGRRQAPRHRGQVPLVRRGLWRGHAPLAPRGVLRSEGTSVAPGRATWPTRRIRRPRRGRPPWRGREGRIPFSRRRAESAVRRAPFIRL